MDWTDDRDIDTLNFGSGSDEAASITDTVRKLFKTVGVKKAEDIAMLGCTGLFGGLLQHAERTDLDETWRLDGRNPHHVEAQRAKVLASAIFVRENMGGAGIGLTCYVGIDRFCLVHNTIGGCEKGQQQRHSEHIDLISRELTDEERGHIHLVENARRAKGKNLAERITKTMDHLSGDDLPPGIESVHGHSDAVEQQGSETQQQRQPSVQDSFWPDATDGTVDAAAAGISAITAVALAGASSDLVAKSLGVLPEKLRVAIEPLVVAAVEATIEPNWKCPEHGAPFWGCRYCTAQLVVEGPLQSQYLIGTGAFKGELQTSTLVDPREVEKTIEQIVKEQDEAGVSEVVALYTKCAVWRRRLARDGE